MCLIFGKFKKYLKINNAKLHQEFEDKKREFDEQYSSKEPSDIHYGFLTTTAEDVLYKLSENGLEIKLCPNKVLGYNLGGVHICRNLDLSLLEVSENFSNNDEMILLIFKYMTGKSKHVPVNYGETLTAPTPRFDSHISDEKIIKKDQHSVQYMKSLVYLYEFVDTMFDPVLRPRHCCPVGAFLLQKTPLRDSQQQSDVVASTDLDEGGTTSNDLKDEVLLPLMDGSGSSSATLSPRVLPQLRFFEADSMLSNTTKTKARTNQKHNTLWQSFYSKPGNSNSKSTDMDMSVPRKKSRIQRKDAAGFSFTLPSAVAPGDSFESAGNDKREPSPGNWSPDDKEAQINVKMSFFNRGNFNFLQHNGYLYRLEVINRRLKYYKCRKMGCHGRISLHLNNTLRSFLKPHLCIRDELETEAYKALSLVLNQVPILIPSCREFVRQLQDNNPQEIRAYFPSKVALERLYHRRTQRVKAEVTTENIIV